LFLVKELARAELAPEPGSFSKVLAETTGVRWPWVNFMDESGNNALEKRVIAGEAILQKPCREI
jgi:hypothetical protein